MHIKKYKNFNQISPVALHLFQESAILNRIVKWRDDMSQAVVIKSNKYGIHLVLSNEISFKALLDAIVEKFKESEKFFKGAKLAISFEGRKLTHDEEMAIIDAVTSNTSIEILCIVDHDPDREAYVKQQIEEYQASVQQPYVDGGTQFYRGTLRSGQTLESETGIVVVGDVNPGAAVMANGSIVVLGAVKGSVYAGLGGDDSAFIVALDMDPIQIRIGNILAKSPDKPFSRRRIRKKVKETTTSPQIAYLKDGTICIEPLTKELLSDI
ncbi:septum site-determining protein MinC [Roseburia intestinalis L1-82]|uniref:Probable septum site-determining protein MinC n=4 Tax=Roseburia intestinalis TaxID=166486 RepID=C7GCF4_9FIRM|nr:septum site-determining protein MinC [Roseburia intestinalis L1-82]